MRQNEKGRTFPQQHGPPARLGPAPAGASLPFLPAARLPHRGPEVGSRHSGPNLKNTQAAFTLHPLHPWSQPCARHLLSLGLGQAPPSLGPGVLLCKPGKAVLVSCMVLNIMWELIYVKGSEADISASLFLPDLGIWYILNGETRFAFL